MHQTVERAPRRAIQIKVHPLPRVSPKLRVEKRDWAGLLNSTAQPGSLGIPPGFHTAAVLRLLIDRKQPVTGLVVSIGANMPVPGELVALIRTLTGPGDFAAQSCSDEFLLVYPRVQGAAAQRRLVQVVQQLWDFQLGHLSRSILFSWGGIEARNQPIGEAAMLALEQMYESRRGRKMLMAASA